MSCFNTELCRQADIEVQALRELNKKAARMSRGQNTRRRVKRRVEVLPEERIQDRDINAAHQRASRKRLTLWFVGTATGELEVFQEQAHLHLVPPVEEICQFFQLLKGKVELQIVAVVAEKCSHRCMILLKSSKSFFCFDFRTVHFVLCSGIPNKWPELMHLLVIPKHSSKSCLKTHCF
jgi:hypothetical protein